VLVKNVVKKKENPKQVLDDKDEKRGDKPATREDNKTRHAELVSASPSNDAALQKLEEEVDKLKEKKDKLFQEFDDAFDNYRKFDCECQILYENRNRFLEERERLYDICKKASNDSLEGSPDYAKLFADYNTAGMEHAIAHQKYQEKCAEQADAYMKYAKATELYSEALTDFSIKYTELQNALRDTKQRSLTNHTEPVSASTNYNQID